VKYLREVTPYFRRTSCSALSDVGWTDDVKSSSTSSASERAIPLQLCYVCRADSSVVDSGSGSSSPTLQSVTLELQSPDRRSSCLLRCADEDAATQWLTAICNVVASLTTRAVADVNIKSSVISSGTSSPNNNSVPAPLGSDVKHLGWLCEQVTRDRGMLLLCLLERDYQLSEITFSDFRPHRITIAAYCYTQSTMVSVSVCLSVGHLCKPSKNG